jgi:hypothetical protein
MATNLTIVLPDRPGALVSAWNELKAAGVNVDGACGFPQQGTTWGFLHVLVTDREGARRAIEAAGFQIAEEREVEVHEAEDKPGALTGIFEQIADSGRNVDLMYVATNNRIVIGTDDGHERRSGYSTLGEKR